MSCVSFGSHQLLKKKSQVPEKPVVVSQVDSKKQPRTTHHTRKVERDEVGTGKMDPEATGGSAPPGPLTNRKVLAPSTKASGAEHNEKGTKKRTNGDISPKQGDLRHRKRKAGKVAAAAAPALPTE